MVIIAMLCIVSIFVLSASTAQLRDLERAADHRDDALQLHVRSVSQVLGLDQSGSDDERNRTRNDELASSRETPATTGNDDQTTNDHVRPTGSRDTATSAPEPATPVDPPTATHRGDATLTVSSHETSTTTTTARHQPPQLQADANTTETSHARPVDQSVPEASISRDRGVIIALHNGIVAMGVSLIKDLRCLGNNELIQVYHCFPDELSAESRSLLLRNETRLEIVDVCTQLVNQKKLTMTVTRKFQNWWVKPLALLHTDLRHVIVLDADVIPMRDPAVLRTLPGYVRTGTTFFYDRVTPLPVYFNANANARGARNQQLLRWWIETFNYAAFNLTGPAPSSRLRHSLAYSRQTCHEMDSSMVAVDKARAGNALDVLWLLVTKTRFALDFSWGDKEAFWLAFEFAQVEYFFSPWGVSVVSSSPNQDMEKHPDTLCGSLAHFLPVEHETPELLYVNGKALIDPYPVGVQELCHAKANVLFNVRPTHVTPRHVRKEKALNPRKYSNECLVGLGSTPLPEAFHRHLLHRRTLYMGLILGVEAPLDTCATV